MDTMSEQMGSLSSEMQTLKRKELHGNSRTEMKCH
jgi:hypothetical protein